MAVMVGKGAMTNSIEELSGTNMLLVAGSNTTESHPVISLRMKRAIKNGAKLIIVDPRKIELTKWADKHLQIKIGTDNPLFNAIANVIISEKLFDKEYSSPIIYDLNSSPKRNGSILFPKYPII